MCKNQVFLLGKCPYHDTLGVKMQLIKQHCVVFYPGFCDLVHINLLISHIEHSALVIFIIRA